MTPVFEITAGGKKIAEISKKWFRVRDTYGVDVAPGNDDILMLAITVAIDSIYGSSRSVIYPAIGAGRGRICWRGNEPSSRHQPHRPRKVASPMLQTSGTHDPAIVRKLRPREANMLEYVFRFNVEKGRQNEFIDWLRANEDGLSTHTRPGWTYVGTLMTVGGFGDFDGESRWTLENYASLGEGWGDDVAQRLLGEFFELIETTTDVSLLRNVATVESAPNI